MFWVRKKAQPIPRNLHILHYEITKQKTGKLPVWVQKSWAESPNLQSTTQIILSLSTTGLLSLLFLLLLLLLISGHLGPDVLL